MNIYIIFLLYFLSLALRPKDFPILLDLISIQVILILLLISYLSSLLFLHYIHLPFHIRAISDCPKWSVSNLGSPNLSVTLWQRELSPKISLCNNCPSLKLKILQWLLTAFSLKSGLLSVAFRVFHGLTPAYISSIILCLLPNYLMSQSKLMPLISIPLFKPYTPSKIHHSVCKPGWSYFGGPRPRITYSMENSVFPSSKGKTYYSLISEFTLLCIEFSHST